MNIAIFGYGNLGRGVESALAAEPDMRGIGIFTRRAPETVHAALPVYPAASLSDFRGKIDVLVLCAGSATDLPHLTPTLARDFDLVDSFDTHASLPAHYDAVDHEARRSCHLALIAGGWDPGLFSLARLYASAVLPVGQTYTFWGRGVSQGHSDAIRRIPGVRDARQYTVPSEQARAAVLRGECPALTAAQMHKRECYVVPEPSADTPEGRARITREICRMPHYFAGYDTTVTFLTKEELAARHAGLPHGGEVIRTGHTGDGTHTHRMRLSLTLDSNPEFTACTLLALARAVYRMRARGEMGCRTIFDVRPADLSPLDPGTLRATLL